jgi:spore coat polysaccharide biosynthesis protein SpsF
MENKRVNLAILQARMSSTRLPGKVLAPILGTPMLARQIERIARTRRVDKLIIATSDDPEDGAIERLCMDLGITCFRGSLDDVLDRYYQAALPHRPDHVVRLTGDCPLVDWTLIDRVVSHHLEGNFDYTSNTIAPTYPDGLDVEVFRFACLEEAWREATRPSQREHVTPYLKSGNRFRTANVAAPIDHSNLRWTVDEPEDLALVRTVYEELYPKNPNFTAEDVFELFQQRPDLKFINSRHERDTGYAESILRERRTP